MEKKKKIKVFYIITGFSGGGAEMMLYNLLKNLDQDQFKVMVVALFYGGVLEKNFKKLKINYKIIGRSGFLGIKTIYNLYREIRKFSPDIVHTFLFAAFFRGSIAAKLAGVRKIIHSIQNVHLETDPFRRFIRILINRMSDKLVCASWAIAQEYQKNFKADKEKIIVIYNGVEIEKFYSPTSTLLDSSILRLGSIGRLTKQKGYDVLIKSVSKLTIPFQLNIAGEGEDRKYLESLIKQYNLEDKVKLQGWVDDVRNFLQNIDIFILPSRWEGLGMVLLEAGLAARCIIASRVDGILEILEDQKTALLVNPEDDLALRKVIVWIENNKKLALQMAKSAQKSIAQKFDIKKISKEYEDLYRRVIGYS